LKPISHVADLLHDLEWPEELGPELAMPFDIERCNWMVQEVKPCPLTDHEVELLVLAVVEHLVLLLCLLEPLEHLRQELITVPELCIYRRKAGFTQRVRAYCWGVTTINDIEW
jgi:hypothetical protein